MMEQADIPPPDGLEQSFAGAAPIDLRYKDPACVLVRWICFNSHAIAEPFFFQTIAALRRRAPRPREFVTELDALLAHARSLPQLRPKGIIFHLGRCGSTMLANALRTADGSVILSEMPAVDSICRPPAFWQRPPDWSDRQSRLLDSVVRAFGYLQRPSPNVVIKETTLGTFDMPLLRATWPDIPAVMVIRNPVEILMSFLAKPATYLRRRCSPEILTAFGWDREAADRMTVVEFYARHLGKLCDIAREHMPKNWMVVDFEDLSTERILKIAASFGMKMPRIDSPEFLAARSLYSKDFKNPCVFRDDRVIKQRAATALVRDAVLRWALDPYLALRGHATDITSPDGVS